MDSLETLLSRGAQCVGGDIVFRNKLMGRLRNGVFVPTEDGESELKIEEAVVRTAKPAKAKAAPAPVPVADATEQSEIDKLLG